METISKVLPLLAGIGMFLYGMNLMASSIEKLAGAKLERTMERFTDNRWKGLLLGTGVTAIIQSSAATSITMIGFVNAGIMTLAQTIPVIWGANIGSTATAQLLRLGDLSGGGVFLSMLKPSSFAPVIIVVGAFIMLLSKKRKPKNIANLLIGFGILFWGMTTMEGTFAPLKDSAQFKEMFISFSNPLIGILVGFLLTAVIQSSSATVGILQALSASGTITVATALPILLGQNIGKCVPVVLASIGNNRDAKRASMCYFLFNVFSLFLFGIGVYGLDAILDFAAMDNVVNRGNIATMHTGINLIAALILMPFVKQYDRLLHKLIKDSGDVKEKLTLDCLDDAFLKNPQVAMEQCRKVLFDMCTVVKENVAIVSDMVLNGYNEKTLMDMKVGEEFLDKSEAGINAYMVNVTYHTMTEEDSHLATEILQSVSDLERIGDYCVNLSETAEYMFENKSSFTPEAKEEIKVLFDAVKNVIDLMVEAYKSNDPERIAYVEPMEEVIDDIVDRMKSNHIMRLRNGICTADNGITFTEILTNTERISDHCSNIAIYLMQKLTVNKSFDRKKYQDELHKGVDPRYRKYIDMYKKEYLDRIQCEKGVREAEGM